MSKGWVWEPGTCNSYLLITTDDQRWSQQICVLWQVTHKTKHKRKKEKETHNSFVLCRALVVTNWLQTCSLFPTRAGSPQEKRFHQPEKGVAFSLHQPACSKCSETNAWRQPTAFIKYQQKKYGRYMRNLNHLMPCNLCQITKKNIVGCQFFWLMWPRFTFLWSFS